jgi:hypothetical protein
MRISAVFLLASCAAFAGAPPSEPYTREVVVPEAGWYRVPVDGHIWRYARGRVLAFDESGKQLPCGILPVEMPSPASEEAQPRLAKVEEESNHLILYLQVDRRAGKHNRLILDFGGADLLEQVALWGSLDGQEWEAMAQGTLFRLGSGERMQGTALDYPASSFDQLKLVLPKGSGELKQAIRDFRVGNIRLHYAPDDVDPAWVDEQIAIQPADPDLAAALTGSDEQLFRLDLPTGLMSAHRIALELELPHVPLPISLMQMEKGNPEWVYSCTLDTKAESLPIPSGQLRTPAFLKIDRQLSLSGGIIVKRPIEEIIFFAERPGALILAYGGVEERPTGFPPVHKHAETREAALGPVAEHPMALSRELRNIAANSPTWKFDPFFQWELNLPAGAVPGQWVTVEVTPDMMAIINETREGGWGIVAGDRVIDHIWKVDSMPVLVMAAKVRLAPEKGLSMRSSGEVIYHKPSGIATWLTLKARLHGEPIRVTVEVSPPIDTHVVVQGERPARPWLVVGRETIECGPWATDCMTTMECVSFSFEKILITAEGMNLLPPDSLNLSLWRYRDRLVFPVPFNSNPKLFFGNYDHGIAAAFESHIDRERFSEDLPAALIGALTDQAEKKRPWDRILFIAGLVLAAAALLYLIVKLLPRREG